MATTTSSVRTKHLTITEELWDALSNKAIAENMRLQDVANIIFCKALGTQIPFKLRLASLKAKVAQLSEDNLPKAIPYKGWESFLVWVEDHLESFYAGLSAKEKNMLKTQVSNSHSAIAKKKRKEHAAKLVSLLSRLERSEDGLWSLKTLTDKGAEEVERE